MGNSGVIERLNRYIYGTKGDINFLGNVNFRYATIQDYMKNIVEFEKPDAYSIVGDAVCIIEHFEFDSAKSIKGGKSKRESTSKREIGRVEREFDKVAPIDEGITLRDTINVHHSATNYMNNALRNIANHYTKIDSYKMNLIQTGIIDNNCKFEVGFFIEDTTLLGNIYESKEWKPPTPIFLPHCKQFLDFFDTACKLDFCICTSSYGTTDFIWFINRESIQDYRKIQIDLDEIAIIDFSPRVFGWKTIVPHEVIG